MARIAVLEDDTAQAEQLKLWLLEAGHACVVFQQGFDFLGQVARETFDLYILDWRLPDVDGADVLKSLRKPSQPQVPVLFETGRDAEEDIVHALAIGADDYLVKPLRRNELVARVNALLRRGQAPRTESSLELGGFRIDAARREVFHEGVPIELTQKEFDLAHLLFKNAGRILSRQHILDVVWGMGVQVKTRTIDTHVSQLRVKLQLYPAQGWRLSAVYQHGYRLEYFDPAHADGGLASSETH